MLRANPTKATKKMLNYLAARFANADILLSEDKAAWLEHSLPAIEAGLTQVGTRMSAEGAEFMAQDDFWPAPDSWLSMYRPYVVVGGTLMVPVKGMLLHECTYAIGGWATGYAYLVKAFQRGMEDPEVKRIAMIVNSPGGEVAGCFDSADVVYGMRGQKPIRAFVHDAAYSAAFAWATSADKVIVTRTAGVGSVGVVTAHLDVSAAMDKAGYKMTFIYAGDRKVDGNPYQALPDEVKARIQARLESMYTIFVSTTARNLGLDETVVRGTQAGTFGAQAAVEIGFAHEISSFDDAMAAFSGELDNPAGEQDMELTPEQEKAVQARIDTASASAKAEGLSEGASAEQARIKGIMGCDAAKTRPAMASHLALNTRQGVEEATGILGVSAPEKAAAAPANTEAAKPGADFSTAMDQSNPNLGAGAGDQGDTDSAESFKNEVLAATGFKGA